MKIRVRKKKASRSKKRRWLAVVDDSDGHRQPDRNRSATMVCSTCGRGTRLQKICARKRRRKKKTGEDKRKKRRQEKKGLNPTWSRQLSNCCPRTKGRLWLVFGNQTGCTKLQQEGKRRAGKSALEIRTTRATRRRWRERALSFFDR